MTEKTIENESSEMREALNTIRGCFSQIPPILVVAGSGLGGFASTLQDPKKLSYEEIPNFPGSTVAGHEGNLVCGQCGNQKILVMNGRKHLYEGVDAKTAVFPLRTLMLGGVKTVILSNAAGGLNKEFQVGDLMLIKDQINFQFRNPLIGPNNDEIGPRFPDMSEPYSRRLMKIARETATELKITLREGVYLAGLGPSYETKAEVRMLKKLSDVVGMSTVPETLSAVHAGAEVLGITLVSNSLVQEENVVTTHEEVMEAGKKAGETFNKLVTAIIEKIDQPV